MSVSHSLTERQLLSLTASTEGKSHGKDEACYEQRPKKSCGKGFKKLRKLKDSLGIMEGLQAPKQHSSIR